MERLSLHAIAKIYGKCTKTFRGYVQEMKIPHIRLGRDMLFDPVEVEQHLVNLTRSQIQPEPDLKAKTPSKKTQTTRTADQQHFAELLGL